MHNPKKTRLVLALKLALVAGFGQQAHAEAFPARLNLTDLNGSNGVAIIGRSEGEASGFSVNMAGDVNGDGIEDVIIGAYRADNTIGGVDSGRSYIIYGSNNPLVNPIQLDDFSDPDLFSSFSGESSSALGVRFSGFSVSAAGDFNDNGIDDFLIGAPGNRIGVPLQATTGRAYVVFGSPFLGNAVLGSLTGSSGFPIDAKNSIDTSIGYSMSSAGDFNGDGIDDIIIGAPRADLGSYSSSGRSYIIFGTSSISSPFDLASLDGNTGVILNRGASDREFGALVNSIGDFNGDGLDDVVIGSPGSMPNGNNSGNTYIVFGTDSILTGPIDMVSLNGNNGFVVTGETTNDRSGVSASSAGDINGDGFNDVIIGAPYSSANLSFAGRSYLIFGTDQTVSGGIELSSLDGTAGIVIEGATANDASGFSVSGGSDLNGDGMDDLIIGAPFGDSLDADGEILNTDTGIVHVVFGSSQLSSPFQLSSLDGSNGFSINGEARLDRLGRSVDIAGDFNNDGTDDLIMGAYRADQNGDESGSSYIVFGRSLNDLSITKSNGTGALQTGEVTTWRIEVTNLGPYQINNAVVTDHVPGDVINASWNCIGQGGAVCPNASGPGAINELVDLPASSTLVYELTGTVDADEPATIFNTATVEMPPGVVDLNPANNIAMDNDPIGLFADGFESDG